MHGATDKRVFAKEARSLVEVGHEVIHLAPGNSETWQQDGVQIVAYPAGGRIVSRLLRLFRLYRYARRLQADVYHCNEVDSWMVGVALRLLHNKVCVFDVHEHYPEEFAERRFPAWTRAGVRTAVAGLMRLLSVKTDRIVLAKRSLAPAFSHLPGNKVWLVQNFVSMGALPPPPVKREEQTFRLVHLGLMNRHRGWPQLLEGLACAQWRNVELLVIGTINDGSTEEFWKSVNDFGLTGRVIMEPWLPYDEAMARVAASNVGVISFQPGLFNHKHALPHKLFDYMGVELPVIAPQVSIEVCEIVNSAECGVVVDTSDPHSIARAIDWLCGNREEAHAMGRRGRTAILDRYNWQTEGAKLVDMYGQLEAKLRVLG